MKSKTTQFRLGNSIVTFEGVENSSKKEHLQRDCSSISTYRNAQRLYDSLFNVFTIWNNFFTESVFTGGRFHREVTPPPLILRSRMEKRVVVGGQQGWYVETMWARSTRLVLVVCCTIVTLVMPPPPAASMQKRLGWSMLPDVWHGENSVLPANSFS